MFRVEAWSREQAGKRASRSLSERASKPSTACQIRHQSPSSVQRRQRLSPSKSSSHNGHSRCHYHIRHIFSPRYVPVQKLLLAALYSRSPQTPLAFVKTGVLFTHWIADSLTLWKTPVTDAHLWVAARYYHVLTKGAPGVGYVVAAAATLGAVTILWSLRDGEAGNLMFDGGSICEFTPTFFFLHLFANLAAPACLLILTAPISPVQYRHLHLCTVCASQYVQIHGTLSRRSLTPHVLAPFQAYSPTMSCSHPITLVPSSHPTCAPRRSDSHRAISSAASHLPVCSPCRQAGGGPSVQTTMPTPRRSSAHLRRKAANRDLRKLRRAKARRA
jgi:ER membrane protein SH3